MNHDLERHHLPNGIDRIAWRSWAQLLSLLQDPRPNPQWIGLKENLLVGGLEHVSPYIGNNHPN
jgi:hypothetical protein